MNCTLEIACHAVAVNSGLAVMSALLARLIARQGVGNKHDVNRLWKWLIPLSVTVVWGLSAVFAVSAFIGYFQPGGNVIGGSSSELMMAFIGVAFAMFTGIAVFLLAEARKELSDARKEWNKLPDTLDLLHVAATANMSMHLAQAAATPRHKASAKSVLVCHVIKDVLDRVTIMNVRCQDGGAISKLKTLAENEVPLKYLKEPDMRPIRRYLIELRDELITNGLVEREAMRLLAEIVNKLATGTTD